MSSFVSLLPNLESLTLSAMIFRSEDSGGRSDYQGRALKNGLILLQRRFPWWLSGKESACQAGDAGSIPGSGRSPGEGNDNPLQYSHLGNPMNRGAWQATVHGVVKSRTRLSD